MASRTPKAVVEDVEVAEEEVAPRPVAKLQQFVMPHHNSCSKCGDALEAGDPVFANNWDEVLSGQGVCKKHVKA